MSVIVFGSLNADTTLDVSHMPDWGETILADGWSTAAGGKGANQAVAASRAGASRVVMVGRVGNDGPGVFLRAELAASGVVDRVVADPLEATGGAYILRGEDGANAIVVAPGANSAIAVDDLLTLEEPDERTVLVLQLEVPVDAVRAAAALARKRGWLVVLNTAPVRPGAEDLLEVCDILVANEVEAGQLTGLTVTSIPEALVAGELLRTKGPSRVAVTLGELGAVLVAGGAAWHARPPAVEVVDTTAAGDAFVASLAVALAGNEADDRALALAVTAGSLAATAQGAQPSLPERSEILRTVSSVRVERIGAPRAMSEGVPM